MQDRTPGEREAFADGYEQALKDIGGPLLSPRVNAIYPDKRGAAARSMRDGGAWIEEIVAKEMS